MLQSLLCLLVLAADISPIVNVAQSRTSSGTKVVWIATIDVLPILGFIAGPKSGSR